MIPQDPNFRVNGFGRMNKIEEKIKSDRSDLSLTAIFDGLSLAVETLVPMHAGAVRVFCRT
jgi:hypothetical protein